MKKLCLVAILGLSTLASTAYARNDTFYIPIGDIVKESQEAGILDKDIQFYFGKSSGTIIREGLISNRKTRSRGSDPAISCRHALLSALKAFQNSARKVGATKVVNLTSYYNYKTVPAKHGKTFECHVGNIITGITLKGDLAK